jgi:thiol-disulfide isomerase/thioredoxin
MNFFARNVMILTAIAITGYILSPNLPISNAPMAIAQTANSQKLANSLQGKPVLIDIYATWCGRCKTIAPTLSQIKDKYKDKVHFLVFDVSDRNTLAQAEVQAEKLGLKSYFAKNRTYTSLVSILDPRTGQVVDEFQGNPNLQEYVIAIDKAIARFAKK